MKELAKIGREYLEQLEEARKMFIFANRQQVEVSDEKSKETLPKKK